MLVEETVDVTLPWDRRPRGARHPLTTLRSGSPTSSSRWATRSPRGPRSRRSGSTSTRSTSAGPPGPRRAWTRSSSEPARPTPALVLRTAHLAGAGPGAAGRASRRSTWSCPGRIFRTDELDATHSRSSTRSRAWRSTRASPWPTCGHAGPLRRGDVRRRAAHPAPAALLPVHRAVRRVGPAVLRLPRRVRRRPGPALPDLQVGGLDRVGRLRHGQPAGADRLRHRPRRATPASRSAWASSAR